MKNFISPKSHGSTPNLDRIVNLSRQTVDVLKMSLTLTDGKRSMAIPLEVTGSPLFPTETRGAPAHSQ